MKGLKLSTLLSVVGAVAAGALLFWTSQNVQESEGRLRHLQKSVKNETQTIRVLHAEWDYLNRPDRIDALAIRYLGASSAEKSNVPEGVSALPDLLIPALPQHKPFPEAEPVMMRSSGFSALLRNVNTEGGAHE